MTWRGLSAMLFSEPLFLFAFLPLVLADYFLSPMAVRNLILVFASLVFYAFGSRSFLLILCASVALNYVLALGIDGAGKTAYGRALLIIGIGSDLMLLGLFKYSGFLGLVKE